MKKGKHYKNSNSSIRILRKFVLALILIGFSLIIYSTIHIYKWYRDSNYTKDITNQITDDVTISEIDDGEFVNQEDNPYWSYMNMKLIDVDFSKLEEINSDIVRLDSS